MTARCKNRAALIGLTVDEAHAIMGGKRSNVPTELGKRGLGTREGVVYDRVAERHAAMMDLESRRSTLPDAPCFLCGTRDWCRHNPNPARAFSASTAPPAMVGTSRGGGHAFPAALGGAL